MPRVAERPVGTTGPDDAADVDQRALGPDAPRSSDCNTEQVQSLLCPVHHAIVPRVRVICGNGGRRTPRMASAIASIVVASATVGCLPHRWVYLRIPMLGPPGEHVVELPLERVYAAHDDFRADNLAFYDRGREPRPFRLIDRDGDGTPDHALVLVRLPEPDQPRAQLTVLGVSDRGADHPPPMTLDPAREADPEVQLDFAAARRRR